MHLRCAIQNYQCGCLITFLFVSYTLWTMFSCCLSAINDRIRTIDVDKAKEIEYYVGRTINKHATIWEGAKLPCWALAQASPAVNDSHIKI